MLPRLVPQHVQRQHNILRAIFYFRSLRQRCCRCCCCCCACDTRCLNTNRRNWTMNTGQKTTASQNTHTRAHIHSRTLRIVAFVCVFTHISLPGITQKALLLLCSSPCLSRQLVSVGQNDGREEEGWNVPKFAIFVNWLVACHTHKHSRVKGAWVSPASILVTEKNEMALLFLWNEPKAGRCVVTVFQIWIYRLCLSSTTTTTSNQQRAGRPQCQPPTECGRDCFAFTCALH